MAVFPPPSPGVFVAERRKDRGLPSLSCVYFRIETLLEEKNVQNVTMAKNINFFLCRAKLSSSNTRIPRSIRYCRSGRSPVEKKNSSL